MKQLKNECDEHLRQEIVLRERKVAETEQARLDEQDRIEKLNQQCIEAKRQIEYEKLQKEEEQRKHQMRKMDHKADLERFTEESAEIMTTIKEKENELTVFANKFDEVKRQIEDRFWRSWYLELEMVRNYLLLKIFDKAKVENVQMSITLRQGLRKFFSSAK